MDVPLSPLCSLVALHSLTPVSQSLFTVKILGVSEVVNHKGAYGSIPLTASHLCDGLETFPHLPGNNDCNYDSGGDLRLGCVLVTWEISLK